MTTTIKTKNSVTTTSAPSSLAQGELAVNITDKKMWVGNASSTPVQILGGGATNRAGGSNTQVQYNSSGDLAGSSSFVFDGTNVGIGISSPSYKLDVAGLVASQDAYLITANSSGTPSAGAFMFRPASNTLAFGTASAERMRIDSNGNLGLGVTPSAWQTSTKAIQNSYFAFSSDGSVGDLSFNRYVNSGGASTYITTAAASLYRQDTGSHKWFTAPSGTAGNAISFTQAMTLDTSGNLLVGTTSARARLVTASNTVSDPGIFALASNGSFTNAVIAAYASRNTTNGTYELISAGCDFVATRFRVFDSGNVQNTNNSYGGISDAKLKENIVDATPKLEKLNQVRIVNYNFKNDQNHKQIGVIAQELEQIFPSMVEEITDRDQEGNDLGTTTKSVKYSVFVPMLIKAIQEQQAMIVELKAKVEALENK